MSLPPGTRLGAYEILSPIGAGGMGEVYRARDTKLGRDVAIKIVSSAFTSEPDRLARFEREALVLASLKHPNIATIHGVEESGGIRALVLELVDGETLAERIARGATGVGLPVKDALEIARQIAAALDAAHERGVVHRDLKPANIKIAPDGLVKVLDFGLAKATLADETAADLTHSPTLVAGTREGVILGTAAYMSPEQARGKPVDKRTDIWAFGCVFYEMLTGRAAFSGETVSDIAARILEREPDWHRLPPDVPDGIRRLLTRCLRKDPADRLHDIADARIEIVDARSEPQAGGADASRVRGKERSLWLALALTVIAAALAVGLALWYRGGSAPVTSVIDFSINLGDNTPGYGIAVSPDGRRIAIGALIGGRPQIWVQSLDASGAGPLAGTELALYPFWSPDGSSLGFLANGKLQRIDRSGGPPVVICDAPGLQGGSWNADGLVMFSSRGQLFRVPASGGTPARVALADAAGERSLRSHPHFLPDNRHFLYHVNANGRRAVYLGSVDGSDAKPLVDSEFPASYAAPGYVMFVRGTALLAQAIDPNRLSLVGEASVVASHVMAGYVGGLPAFSVSNNGVLAFVPTLAGSVGQLTWFDRTGRTLGSIQRPSGDEYLNPAISPNGELVAVNRMDPQNGNWDIWVVDVIRGVSSRFTSDPAQDADPVWSPDGKEILFASDRGGQLGLYRKAVGGSKREELLARIEGDVGAVVPTDWSRDGKFVLYSQFYPDPWSLWALPLVGDRKPILILRDEFENYAAHLSPDGNWIAYTSTESGTYDVYIQRFLSPGPKMRIAPGVHPRWNKNGRELVFWSEPGGLTSVPLELSSSGVSVGIPKPLVIAKISTLLDARPHYDFTRDGERFLIRQPAGPSGSTASVIVNWPAKLKK